MRRRKRKNKAIAIYFQLRVRLLRLQTLDFRKLSALLYNIGKTLVDPHTLTVVRIFAVKFL